jgi:hypothetical protein
MKLIIKSAIILLGVVIFVANLNLKANEQSTTAMTVKEDFNVQWKALFTNIVRPPQLCIPPDHLKKYEDPDKEEGVELKIPKPKPNPWAKQQGFGPSAYLFDYLDDIFKNDIVKEFNDMWAAAKQMPKPDPKIYDDPYSLEKLLFFYSQGAQGKAESEFASTADPTQLVKIIQQNYNKNFDPNIWSNSISAPQIFYIVQQWGWYQFPHPDFPRKIVSWFDFDGDGRLNPSEFILFSIVINKNMFRKHACNKFCFSEVLATKIDPLFAFLDCDGDGWASAENMWLGLPNLRRTDPTKYNLYNCQLPHSINKGYRTTSMNDFILKNYRAADGFVNLHEFRAGILLGYWDRMVDSRMIYTDDTRNLKSLRWANDGSDDISCKKILAMMPNFDPGKATLTSGNPGG